VRFRSDMAGAKRAKIPSGDLDSQVTRGGLWVRMRMRMWRGDWTRGIRRGNKQPGTRYCNCCSSLTWPARDDPNWQKRRKMERYGFSPAAERCSKEQAVCRIP